MRRPWSIAQRRAVSGRDLLRTPGHRIATALLSLVLLSGVCVVDAAPAQAAPCTGGLHSGFSDLADAHPFCFEIMNLVGIDAFHGYADGTFKPGAAMTRQSAASAIYNMLFGPIEGPTPHVCEVSFPSPFSDVPNSHAFCAEIVGLLPDLVISGYPDGTFRPTSTVSRQAAAVWMAYIKAAGEPSYPPCVSAPFPDVPVSSPFCEEIKFLKDTGVATGYADGGFHPGGLMTRQAFAAFAWRVFE